MDALANLAGIWDLYSGPVHSELVLRPEGTYSHSFMGGMRGHWGTWSLETIQDHPVLLLKLQGAQPLFDLGPFGPQPVQWPAVEQLAVTGVQLNQVSFYGALMVRRFSVPVQSPGQQNPDASSAPAYSEEGADLQPSVSGFPEPVAAPASVAPSQSATPSAPSIVGGLDFSSLGPYAQTPPAPPQFHAPAILNQWTSIVNPQQILPPQPQFTPAQFSPGANFAPPTADMLTEQNQMAIDNFNLQHKMNAAWLDASQQAALDTANASHAMAKKWIAYAGS